MRAEAGVMQPQAKPRNAGSPQKLGEARNRLLLEPREGTQSCQHTDFSSETLTPEFCPPRKGKRMR